MSQFTEFSSVCIPNKQSEYFTTLDELVYERFYEGSGDFIIVPDGFETDFASTYFIFGFKPYDRRWILGAIIHDYLWSKARTLKEYQDGNDDFFEAIQTTGTPRWIAVGFYLVLSLTKYFYYGMHYFGISKR